jgi:5-methylcytosine-specific restriction endonuclease McrA
MNGDHVPLSLQRRIRRRAGERCEYCHISQSGQEATFHVDHVHPRREGGPSILGNLALCCVSCSLRKGARTHLEDPITGEQVKLFNPRLDRWDAHFEVTDDMEILGTTPTGRATVNLLRMNRPIAVEIRREEALKGRYP